MGLEEMGRVNVADVNKLRETGSRLSRTITEAMLAEVKANNLTLPEAWAVLVGTMYQVGKVMGSGTGSMLDNVRQAFLTLDKQHSGPGGLIL